jgi:hypothetical protein
MFQYYAELPEDGLNMLKQLKISIKNCSQNTPEYTRNLDEYYAELSELCPLLTDPLPPDCELDGLLLPEWYLDFKREYQKTGPYTFFNHCQAAKLIIFVQVISVQNKGAEVSAKLLEIFEGEQNELTSDWFGYVKFKVYTAWSYARFEKGEKALVLLDKAYDNSAILLSSDKKFKVTNRDGIEIATAQKTTKSYWHSINVPKIQENNFVIILWNDLRVWIRNNL